MSLMEGSGRGARSVWKTLTSRSVGIWLVLLVLLGLVGAGAREIVMHPPMQGIEPGEVGIRFNRLTGAATALPEGGALVLPGVHVLRKYSLRDQVYKPVRSARATGDAPFQSVEGLSIGVDLTVRYALDPSRITSLARTLPESVGRELVEPVVEGAIYRVFARHTVREIFSSQRQEIQQAIEEELKPQLTAEGVLLKAVFLGNVDLPPDYRKGMENLLAEELAADQMRYTLDLKEKQVKQSELEAEAQKVRRAKEAESEANRVVVEARAQEEAMQHVLPFKQKQIEQRRLEAEADKEARLKAAQTSAEARRIEAAGEADSRRKLAEADAYRMEVLGKTASEQLARDADVISRNPLLIQKTLADKLSDKISVIIAPPPASGGFIGAALIGSGGAVPASGQAGRSSTPSLQSDLTGDAE